MHGLRCNPQVNQLKHLVVDAVDILACDRSQVSLVVISLVLQIKCNLVPTLTIS